MLDQMQALTQAVVGYINAESPGDALRIEEFTGHPPAPIDVVTARALAPLPELLARAYPLLKKGSCGLFPKGQDVAVELTEAAKYWKVQASLAPSRTDPKARIVVVYDLEPVSQRAREQAMPGGRQGKGNRS